LPWLALGVIPLLFYFFRTKFKKFPVLFAAHIVVLVAVKLIFNDSLHVNIYMFATIVYIVNSIVLRLKTTDFQDNALFLPVAAGIDAASLFLLKYLLGENAAGSQGYEHTIIIVFIAVFGMSMLKTYLESYINFLIVNRSSTGHIPAREIFSSGFMLAVLCVLFMMIFLLLTSGIGWLKSILHLAGTAVAAVLRVIFALIGSDDGEINVDDAVEGISAADFATAEESEPALIWQILTVVAFVAIVAVIVILLVKFIKKAYAFIKERMKYTGIEADNNSLSGVTDIREKCVDESNKRKKQTSLTKLFFDRLSPAEKIRRLYKKNILKLSADNADSLSGLMTMTADECGEVLNIPQMALIYDRARYSTKEPANEDVKAFKKAFKEKF
jgi:hypothetical protein